MGDWRTKIATEERVDSIAQFDRPYDSGLEDIADIIGFRSMGVFRNFVTRVYRPQRHHLALFLGGSLKLTCPFLTRVLATPLSCLICSPRLNREAICM